MFQPIHPGSIVPIAICGMGMRLPGGIHHEEELYNFLIEQKDARTIVPPNRYNVDAHFSPHGKKGTVITRQGYFLDADLSNFDPTTFKITATEASHLDPNQRLSLEVVREALESAGEINWRGKKIGTYVGLFGEDWQDMRQKDASFNSSYGLIGALDYAIANRISYEYDLKGPSVMVKTACSSAAVGLHEAMQEIQRGNITSAIVAGANLIFAPGMTVAMSIQAALSPEGSSKSFDAAADGYARGEAVTAIYIKRLDEAIRDGNPIRAILRASSSNSDGRTLGFSTPNADSHEAAMREAYSIAGLDFSQTAMVEAHGTGTATGDPIEAEAIARCFGKEGVYIGAVKPNLGHSEGAAALTSLIKAVVSLEHQTIIPNIKFKTPNPAIPWETAKLQVPVKVCPWPKDRAERLSVNSYGIGGSNVHFILDSAASFGLGRPKSIPPAVNDQSQRRELLIFSAGHPESVKSMVKNHRNYLAKFPDRLRKIAYNLSERRERLKYRAFCVSNGNQLLSGTAAAPCRDLDQIAFVFTGQGAQWVHMGRDLVLEFPPFLENIRSMDRVLKTLEHAPSWSIEDTLCHTDDGNILSQPEYSQTICTALQIGLVDLLESWGVKPSAVVGHSSGEIAASYSARALTKTEAITIAFYRGHVCKDPPQKGAMAAVGLGKAQVAAFLLPGVTVACENSPSSVTLAGNVDALETTMVEIKKAKEETFVRRLKVEMAYHSGTWFNTQLSNLTKLDANTEKLDHMRDLGDKYRDLVASHLDPRPPRVPFYSSAYGGKVLSEASQFGPHYWQENLENPVLFNAAVKSMVSTTPQLILLEVGPHSSLRGALSQITQPLPSTVLYVPTLIRGKNDTESFLSTIGQLFTAGVDIRTHSDPTDAIVLPDLPTYPFHYEKSYWVESRVMSNWRFPKHLPHDLLGIRTLEGTDMVPTWRNNIQIYELPWLRDHRVGRDIVFPAACYIALAGEAAFQLADGAARDYTVKSVDLHQALLLQEDAATEIVTTLRPQRLTTSLNSDWYEFLIVSHDGETWKKHCSGLVRIGRASTPPPAFKMVAETLPRKVSSTRWYETGARVGLNYGPCFTGLQNITAGVTETRSAADIIDKPETASESTYPLHPITLDLAFQALTVAIFQGDYRTVDYLPLPKFLGEIYVGHGTGKKIHICSTSGGQTSSGGHLYGIGEDGDLLLYLKDPVHIRLEKDSDATEPMGVTLEWKPDFSFLDSGKLTKPIYDIREQLMLGERLYVLCALETNIALQGISTAQPHLEQYRQWLGTQCARLAEPGYILVEDSVDLVNMASKDRRKLIPKVLEQCKAIGCRDIGIAIWKAYDQLVNIFEGKTDFLDLVINDGTLSNVYNWANDMWDVSEFFQLLGHMQPQMKVLEIGAGTGGLTAKVLEHLRSAYGERLYLKYTFTDVSSGFFPAANKRFAEYQAIEYKVLDISRHPLEQGFQREEYDLIIASNVLHATPILHDTLVHVRTLLKPQGRLFLQELSPVGNSMGYIMGIFSGWWLGAADGRDGKPFISPEEWGTRLRSAGFNGCETVKFDNEKPYHLNANIVARPEIEVEYSRTITLLSGPSAIHPLALRVETLLQKKGYQTMHCQLGDEQHTIPDQDLISFLDLDQPFLKAPSETDWDQFLSMIGTLQQASVLWLLPLTQIKSNDPHTALILGVARTIRSELAMPLSTLEMESHASLEAAVAVVDVLNKLQQRNEDDGDLDPDMEYCWANGAVHVGRYHWYPVKKALKETAAEPATKVLRIGTYGLLQSLYWSGCALPELGADQVQIQTQAVGLNFKDVLVAMGVVDNASKDAIFGVEGAGYVIKTGANVDHLEVGDRVVYIGASTVGLASEVQRQGCFTLRIPDFLSFEDAATMSAAYVTVLLGVVEKARLERGQSILIHAATGGVGIAAINVARWLGLDIYCTVGSERKVEFLVQQHAIPRDRIFHSRDTSFRDDIMAATNGVGVDCVLNSLSGELLHASWECVAASGCMIEIGKRDMIGRGQLALDRFEDNRTYIGIDLSRYIVTHPLKIMKLMELMLHLCTGAHIRPIDPITLYDANEVQDAFRSMQQGSHIGKVVIKFPEEQGALRWRVETPTPSFKQDRAYLLVGGMGGLGRAIATWMVTHGASHLIFLSRSAGTSENDNMFIQELEARGCTVQAWAGDVADPVTIKNAIQQAPVPIAGVMQMAMVLCDVGILDMSLEDYHTALKPKVDGTWNIHNALPNEYLDFFVMFSSVCGQMGYYGQANYAAANTFLDAFAQYRHSQGLKASVQDIGAINDVGFISQNPTVKASMQAGSTRLITEQDFLDTLQLTIAKSSSPSLSYPAGMKGLGTGLVFHNPSQVTQMSECQLPIMHPENHIIWKRDPRMAIYRNIERTSTKAETTSDGLRSFLSEIIADPALLHQPAAAEFLARELRDRVAAFLMRQEGEESLDLELTLTDAGVDSLVAIEVRNWWKQNLGVEISVLELKNGGSMLDIGGLAAKKLREKLSSSVTMEVDPRSGGDTRGRR